MPSVQQLLSHASLASSLLPDPDKALNNATLCPTKLSDELRLLFCITQGGGEVLGRGEGWSEAGVLEGTGEVVSGGRWEGQVAAVLINQ